MAPGIRFTLVVSLIVATVVTSAGAEAPTLWGVAARDGPLTLEFGPSIVEVRSDPRGQQRWGQRTLRVKRADEPATIDGVLDEQVWSKATAIDPLAPKGPPTRVLIYRDAEHLYVAARCAIDPAQPIQAGAWEPDAGTPWRDDNIEAILVVPGVQPTTYQFIVNAAGSTYSVRNRATLSQSPSSTEEPTVVSDVRSRGAARREQEHWVVEMAIPRELFARDGWPSTLAMNVGRGGPASFEAQSWGGEWGAVGAGLLLMEGDDVKPVAAATHRPATGRHRIETVTRGRGLQLEIERGFARPGDRWLEGELSLSPGAPLDASEVRLEVFALDGERPLASRVVRPSGHRARFALDVRDLRLTEARLVARLIERGQETCVAAAMLSARVAEPLAPGTRVPLKVDAAPQGGDAGPAPVRFGVPFAEGELWDAANVRLIDADGNEIAAQKEVANRWAPDGAIKWLLFDAALPGAGSYSVEAVGPGTANTGSTQHTSLLSVKRDGERIAIDTGAARYLLGKGASPIHGIWSGDQKLASSKGVRGLYVVDQKGRVASATGDEESVMVESQGPVTACVRFEGWYATDKGDRLARHITRLEFAAGLPQVKITHTLVFTSDSNEVWFKDIGWELATHTGGAARAIFAVDRAKPGQSFEVPLGVSDAASAFMLQESHYRFLAGENRFGVHAVDKSNQAKPLHQGAECGDWAALTGERGGLLIGCRESARQHPKEFEVHPDRISLKLFSPRTGEELDFRSPAQVKKWNLPTWLPANEYIMFGYRGQTVENVIADATQLPSNAIGWAKTHELLIAPLPARTPAAAAARIGGTLTFPLLVHVDPQWIYRTEALGPLHPRDAERFAEAEDVLERTIRAFDERCSDMGLYGFVDYASGPPGWPMRGNRKWADPARYIVGYNLQRDLLLMAARSADRDVREFAERVGRSSSDNLFAHWEGPRRVKGAYRTGGGEDGKIATHAGLPYLWEGNTGFDTAASSEPEAAMMLYYMTGDRRSRDVALAFFGALKTAWTPQFVQNAFFVERAVAVLSLGYEFTEDPEFADLVRGTLDLIDDPEARLREGQWVYSPSYKVGQDIQYLIRSVRTVGDPRFREWATVRARYLQDQHLTDVVRYQSPKGHVSAFLYRQEAEPYVAEEMAMDLRQLGIFIDPKTDELLDIRNIPYASGRCGAVMTNLCFGLDVVTRSRADRRAVASWVGAQFPMDPKTEKPLGEPGCVFIQKAPAQKVDLRLIGTAVPAAGEVTLTLIGAQPGAWATDLNEFTTFLDNRMARIQIEKFAPAGTYQLTGGAAQYVIANSRVPMVLYAPGEWTPSPDQRPWVPIFFNVPSGQQGGQITFEGTALLYDPAGKAFNDGKPVTGAIDLPLDRPGLWSFVPVDNKKVKTTNLPPFFAFRDAMFYFEPKLGDEPAKASP